MAVMHLPSFLALLDMPIDITSEMPAGSSTDMANDSMAKTQADLVVNMGELKYWETPHHSLNGQPLRMSLLPPCDYVCSSSSPRTMIPVVYAAKVRPKVYHLLKGGCRSTKLAAKAGYQALPLPIAIAGSYQALPMHISMAGKGAASQREQQPLTLCNSCNAMIFQNYPMTPAFKAKVQIEQSRKRMREGSDSDCVCSSSSSKRSHNNSDSD